MQDAQRDGRHGINFLLVKPFGKKNLAPSTMAAHRVRPESTFIRGPGARAGERSLAAEWITFI